MEKRIIECVPNFSEGRNKEVIRQIAEVIEKSEGVKLLDVDPGEATNRTVVTFVGEPEAVVETALAAVRRASELIDMRQHKGAHPRMGACDVLPLIPVSGVTLDECAAMARKLAERIADELSIPTYCYEAAAFTPERRNLAVCRAGEYEALPEKLAAEDKAPRLRRTPLRRGRGTHRSHGRRRPRLSGCGQLQPSTPPRRVAPTPSRSTCAKRVAPCARAIPLRARSSRMPTATPS